MSDHNPFAGKTGWEACEEYTTEQTYISPEGVHVKGHFAVYAPTQRAAMVTAHVSFVDMIRKLRGQN